MMFQWSEDMVRFMRQASEYGDYHRRLADWMRPDLHKRDRLCDAGCGLGYLSLALAPYVQHITAADRNGDALAVLRENCAARGIDNIDIRCGDLFSMPPDAAYDAMVFCFFGRMEEIAAIAKAQCRGTAFAFKKNYTTHRFSVGSHATGSDSFRAAKAWLRARGVPFTAQELCAVALSDKKRAGGSITYVLPHAIGDCRLHQMPVSDLPVLIESAIHE